MVLLNVNVNVNAKFQNYKVWRQWRAGFGIKEIAKAGRMKSAFDRFRETASVAVAVAVADLSR